MFLEVVIGPMFSGKSTYIHTAVHRRLAVGIQTLVLKPRIDNRYEGGHANAVTHDGIQIPCRTVDRLTEVSCCDLTNIKFIVIEEAQFFPDLVPFIEHMESCCRDKEILVIGLDGDSERRPFGDVLRLIPLADSVTRMNAICAGCRDGTPGLFSYRQVQQGGQVAVGGANMYQTLCRSCYLRRRVVPQ